MKVEWYNKGMVRLSEGENEQALQFFNRVLQHPASLDVRSNQPPGMRSCVDVDCMG